jgi:hypothetical protein
MGCLIFNIDKIVVSFGFIEKHALWADTDSDGCRCKFAPVVLFM